MGSLRVLCPSFGAVLPACVLLTFLATAVAPASPQERVPAELEVYTTSTHLVNLPVEDLVALYPDLASVEFDPDQTHLRPLLGKVGKNVELFLSDFPNTSSKEIVRHERLGTGNKVESKAEREYQYLIFVVGPFQIEEARNDRRGRPVDNPVIHGNYMITSGFAVSCVFFHPSHQHGSRFRYLGKRKGAGGAYVVAFSQRPEEGDCLGSFKLEDPRTAAELYPRVPVETITRLVRGIPLMYQGLADVDPDTFRIVRLRTGLLAPLPEIALTVQDTETTFCGVPLGPTSQPVWLPRDVSVRLNWKGQSYRNFHRYSDYRLFTVETYEMKGRPVTP
jgi:hypothetical protein